MTQYIDGIAEIPQSRCIVSDDYRTITIPAKERTLGCVGDDETRRVWFDMPLSNDGISLRGFALSIHYVNAAGNSNRYDVATAYVVKNRVLFAWLVQRGAYEKAGLVSMSIKMRALDGENVLDEFNSATAPFTVKPAHNYDAQPQPEQEDYIGAFIEQQEARVTAKLALVDEAIADAQDATTAANTAAASATSAAQSANQAATAANSAATDASQAATDATDAAERAEQAAEGVESAIDAATAAATSANSAAATASTAAANADSKAALASTAASTANQAAQAAESATTDANTAAGQATTAAGAANTAAQSATTAAGNADAKAQLADNAATSADTATAAANTATTNATNAAQAANTAAEYAVDAADDMPRLSTTASGTTAQTVNDAWPATPESAVLYGKSVQDGTPTPDNPVPVQVVGGRNLLETTFTGSITSSGVTATKNNDGSITLSGTASSVGTWILAGANPFTDTVFTLAPGTYTLSMGGAFSQSCTLTLFDWANSKTVASINGTNAKKTFTLTEAANVTYVRFQAYSGTYDKTIYPQLEAGTHATPYTPHGCIGLQIGETVTPIDLQGYGIPEGDLLRVDSTGHVTIEKGETPNIIDLGTIDLPELTNPCELAIYASLDPEWAIEYTQDPNVVISTLTGSIAPIEGGTASTNYAVGAYLIHANQLYRVTSAIATGEAITPGTNCMATTVMAELVALTS